MAKNAEGLTVNQQAFVNEFLKDGNAARAYRAAGYKAAEGNSAEVCASKLLRNVKVAAAIKAGKETLRAAVSEKALVDVAYVIKGLKREASFRGEGCSHSARVSALGKLGDHLGMFDEREDENKKRRPPVTVVKVFVSTDNQAADRGIDVRDGASRPLSSAPRPAEGSGEP